jgi:hypothetical protein
MTTEDTAGDRRASAEKKAKLNYPGNSNKDREPNREPEKGNGETKSPEDRGVEKIIKGKVVQKKPSLGSKIAETFNGDDMKTVGEHVLFDVFIPQVRDLLVDMLMQGIQRKFYGDSSRFRPTSVSGRSGGPIRVSSTNYNGISKGVNREDRSSYPPREERSSRASNSPMEFVLEDRGEAEAVLDELYQLLENYGTATVADLYQMVGITGSFTDNKWGWDNLKGADIRRAGRDGFQIILPQPIYLD